MKMMKYGGIVKLRTYMLGKIFRCCTAFIFLFLSFATATLARDSGIHLLYFFSANCPHCKQTTPVISELSKEYPVKGVLSGNDDPGPVPFPMKKGTKEDKERYGIPGVPSLVVLKNGNEKQVVSGEQDIKTVRRLLRAFEKGAMTVSEAFDAMPEGEIFVAGWVKGLGDYFDKDTKFFLTDRRKNIMVNPWLPREVVKSKFKKMRPRMMSDVLGKPVALKGKLVKTETGLRLEVKEEVILE